MWWVWTHSMPSPWQKPKWKAGRPRWKQSKFWRKRCLGSRLRSWGISAWPWASEIPGRSLASTTWQGTMCASRAGLMTRWESFLSSSTAMRFWCCLRQADTSKYPMDAWCPTLTICWWQGDVYLAMCSHMRQRETWCAARWRDKLREWLRLFPLSRVRPLRMWTSRGCRRNSFGRELGSSD